MYPTVIPHSPQRLTSHLSALALVAGTVLINPQLHAAGLPHGHETAARRDRPLYVLYLENDTVAGTDRHYTNGLKFLWFSPEEDEWVDCGRLGKVATLLPWIDRLGGHKSVGVALGQNIYTPQDTTRARPDPQDRPYAGWLYLEFNLVRKTRTLADTLSLQAGIVGPHSYAEDVQQFVHARIGSAESNGWAHQLDDEPAVNLVFERKARIARKDSANRFGFDCVSHFGGSIGNVYTYANAGAATRLGFNLPSDFGVDPITAGAGLGAIDGDDPRVRSSSSMSFFVFAGVDGRAYARNIFLDGNTFTDGPSVSKEPFVADVYFGAGLAVGRWQLTYSYVRRSREFEGQDRANKFGSLTLFCSF